MQKYQVFLVIIKNRITNIARIARITNNLTKVQSYKEVRQRRLLKSLQISSKIAKETRAFLVIQKDMVTNTTRITRITNLRKL